MPDKNIQQTPETAENKKVRPTSKVARPQSSHRPGGMQLGMMDKAKDFKGSFSRLMKLLRPYRLSIFAVMLLSALSTVFVIFAPKILAGATDLLATAVKNHQPIDLSGIATVLLFTAGLYMASSLFSFFAHFITASLGQKIVYGLRSDIKAKLDRLPLSYFDTNSHGDILSRVTNDIENISGTLQQTITQIISAVCTIIGITVMMFTISVSMTLIMLATLPLHVAITVFIAKKSQKMFARQYDQLGTLTGIVEEAYSGHRVVKLFGQEKQMVSDFEGVNSKLVDASFKAQFLSGIIMPLLHLVSNLGYVAVCVAGGILAGRARLTIGGIQAFIQYSSQFSQPISQTANIANVIQSAVAGAERVFSVLDEPEEIPDAAPFGGSFEGNVTFEDVDFSYLPDVPLIEGLNLDVKSGTSIAIVGPTGAGKTTIVNLLMRFYDIDGGKIRIDGKDITELPRKELRELYGMVLQDTWLFSGTIYDNIAYGDENATPDQVKDAAKRAYIDHFINTLPDGYNTMLTEDAGNISQGQKQLLTIARALLKKPKILILDEATSSVDTRTEAAIQTAMTQMMEGRTSFVIAHRLSTIKNAALILVLDKGKVVEQGTHNELLNKGGFYADLYTSQFVGASE